MATATRREPRTIDNRTLYGYVRRLADRYANTAHRVSELEQRVERLERERASRDSSVDERA